MPTIPLVSGPILRYQSAEGKLGDLDMADEKPGADVDITKEWRATHGQQSAAKRLRLFAALSKARPVTVLLSPSQRARRACVFMAPQREVAAGLSSRRI